MKLRLAGVVHESVVDGPGLRCAVFVQGCTRGCPGCHNPHTHSLAGGELIESAALAASILQQPHLDGITLTGGEPFLQAAACAELLLPLRAARRHCLAYTGFTWEEVQARPEYRQLLALLDVLIDGPYRAAAHAPELPFRGSHNQRVINVPRSLATGQLAIIP